MLEKWLLLFAAVEVSEIYISTAFRYLIAESNNGGRVSTTARPSPAQITFCLTIPRRVYSNYLLIKQIIRHVLLCWYVFFALFFFSPVKQVSAFLLQQSDGLFSHFWLKKKEIIRYLVKSFLLLSPSKMSNV